MFRTPSINPAFAHNKSILKQKELIEVEQVFAEIDRIPFRGGRGIRTPFGIHELIICMITKILVR